MAERVFFHVGAPKTGTTYLQDICLHNRDLLAEQGVWYVGERWIDHVHANLVVREHPRMRTLPPEANEAWDRFVEECRSWPGTAIISHEFFAAASAEQAERAIKDLAPAEVHVVFTARDFTRVVPALWQQHLKYGLTTPLKDWSPEGPDSPQSEFSWRTVDPVDVLDRWGRTLPRDQVHLVTVPTSGGDPAELWRRFAVLCGIDPDSCDTTVSRANESLGVVEAELLRRSNEHRSEEIVGPQETARWIHHHLALRVLAPRKGERWGLGPQVHAEVREKSLEFVAALEQAGYDVVGDLQELVSPDETATARTPDDVTDAELAQTGPEVVAAMLSLLRERTLERDRARANVRRLQAAQQAQVQPPVSLARRVRNGLARRLRRRTT